MDKIIYYIEEIENLIKDNNIQNESLLETFKRFCKIFWNYYNNEYDKYKYRDYYKMNDIDYLKLKLYSIRDEVLELIMGNISNTHE